MHGPNSACFTVDFSDVMQKLPLLCQLNMSSVSSSFDTSLNRAFLYGLIGAVGFIVDAGILQLLFMGWEIQPLTARAVSFPLAVTATWLLNRRLTFKDRHVRGRSGYLTYVLGQILGSVLNLAIFTLLLWQWHKLAEYPVIPLAVGAIFGLVFNYAWANILVFRSPNSR